MIPKLIKQAPTMNSLVIGSPSSNQLNDTPKSAFLLLPYPRPMIAEGSKASPETSSKTNTMVRKVASSSLP
jgi:hypothetical protein